MNTHPQHDADRIVIPSSSMPHSPQLTAAEVELPRRSDTHAVIITDAEGLITHWDAGAVEAFGYQVCDTVGNRVDLMIPVHLRDAHWNGFHRAMREPQVNDMAADLPVLCADGQVRTFPGRLLTLSDALGVALGYRDICTYWDHRNSPLR